MTNTRLVVIGYVVLGLLTGLFLEHVRLIVFGIFGPTQPLTRPLYNDWTWCSFIGLGIAAAAGIYLWKTPKTHDVSLEIAAVLLGLFDVFWQFLTDKIQNPSL